MTKNIERKTHKMIKRKIFKNSKSKFAIRRRTKGKKAPVKNPYIVSQGLLNRSIERTTNAVSDGIKDRAYEQTPYSAYGQSSKIMNSHLLKPTYSRVSNSTFSRSFNRRYGKSSIRVNSLANIKRSVAFVLFCILVYFIINIGLTNVNYIMLTNLNYIENVDVEKFKVAMNNSLPIINVTYNSGNIGNPISVQLKSLMKAVFGFDLNAPISILNIQSPYLQTYYKNSYLPYLASNDVNGEEPEFYTTTGKGTDYNDDNIASPNITDGELGNEGSNPSEDITSRGNDREQSERGDNIEEVDDGIMSYYYYEGEEEKLDTPKENILSKQKIAIMNMTNYKIDVDKDVDKLLKEPLNIKLDREGPKILILHTHTSESFIKSLGDVNNKNILNWSINHQENVVRVGHELAEQLKKKFGYDVVHNGTDHDRPDYNKSYDNSYGTIEKYLKSYPSIRVVLDIHRDGLSKEQPKLRVVKKIDGKDVAQIMFVVGTNGNGREHPNWKENLKLALKLQDNLNSQQPGLTRHIYISNNRYNQQFTNGSLTIEIGGDGNLLSECLESVKYLSKAISEVIK